MCSQNCLSVMALTNRDLNFFLLAHLFRAPDIAEAAFSTLDPSHFKDTTPGSPNAHPVQALIFALLQQFWLKYDKKLPDDAYLDASMEAALGLYRGDIVDELRQGYERFKMLRGGVGEQSEQLARAVLRDLSDRFVFKPAIRAVTEEAMVGDSIAGVARKIADIEAKRAGVGGQRTEVGVLSKVIEDNGERLSTAVPWLDARLGGGRGPVIGCLIIILAPQATGKCLGKGTPIRMFDGSVKVVEDIVAGDVLMGPHGQPRNVLGLGRGRDQMFRIDQEWGMPFECNAPHILTLVNSGSGKIIDIPLNEYLTRSKDFKTRNLMFRLPTELPEQDLPIDPYVVGAWLGDGHANAPVITKNDMELLEFLRDYAAEHGIKAQIVPPPEPHRAWSVRLTDLSFKGGDHRTRKRNPIREAFVECVDANGNKFIPEKYLRGSRAQRMRLLAGLLDTDGSLDTRGHVYEFSSVSDGIASGFVDLCHTLGLNVSVGEKIVDGKRYHRFCLSGDGLTELPMLIPRKKPNQVTPGPRWRRNRSKFTVTPIGEGDYYGFELDGDGRFLLADGTVTHNTSLGIQLAVNQALQGNDAMLVLAEEGLTKPMQRRIISCVTGCPTKHIEQAHQLEDAIKSAGVDVLTARKKIALAEKHLHVYDMIRNPGGVDDVIAEIHNHKRKFPSLTYVYVDWAGPIARRMEQQPRKGQPHTMQSALKELADSLARTAAELNINIVTSHQLAPAKVAKGPYAEPSQYDAAECRGFTEMAKYALVINPRTEDGVSICSITKSRDDQPPDKFILRLRGEISTFMEVTDQFEWRGKKIKNKLAGSGKAVPKEDKDRPTFDVES